MAENPIIEMRNISKSFPFVKANDHVNLSLYPGEVHALLGENGAGKSSLMCVLTGKYAPDEGEILFRGKPIRIQKPKDALKYGISMVHQHFQLVGPMTVYENIALASEETQFFFGKKLEKDIVACAEQYGMQIDLNARVEQLSIGEQQRVEIVKLLYQGAEILILDEPTAVLTPQEVDALFSNLHRMAELGKTVVFITHKLNEVMKFSDRITVLRLGKSVATMRTKDTSAKELTSLLVGREMESQSAKSTATTSSEIALQLKGVCAENDRKLPALRDVDLVLHKGEIVCVAGVAGNGQRELGEVIAGLRPISSGCLLMGGEEVVDISPAKMIEKGVGFIPDDRLGVGLIPQMNVSQNLILKSFKSPKNCNHGLLREAEISKMTDEIIQKHNIVVGNPNKPIGLMSGGNQQKLLLAREVEQGPSVVVATYPVRGLDIGATNAIHQVFLEERDNGTAILLISEDLDEIFLMADRIIVLYEGRIAGTLDRKDATYEQVGRLMLGQFQKQGGNAV